MSPARRRAPQLSRPHSSRGTSARDLHWKAARMTSLRACFSQWAAISLWECLGRPFHIRNKIQPNSVKLWGVVPSFSPADGVTGQVTVQGRSLGAAGVAPSTRFSAFPASLSYCSARWDKSSLIAARVPFARRVAPPLRNLAIVFGCSILRSSPAAAPLRPVRDRCTLGPPQPLRPHRPPERDHQGASLGG